MSACSCPKTSRGAGIARSLKKLAHREERALNEDNFALSKRPSRHKAETAQPRRQDLEILGLHHAAARFFALMVFGQCGVVTVRESVTVLRPPHGGGSAADSSPMSG